MRTASKFRVAGAFERHDEQDAVNGSVELAMPVKHLCYRKGTDLGLRRL